MKIQIGMGVTVIGLDPKHFLADETGMYLRLPHEEAKQLRNWLIDYFPLDMQKSYRRECQQLMDAIREHEKFHALLLASEKRGEIEYHHLKREEARLKMVQIAKNINK